MNVDLKRFVIACEEQALQTSLGMVGIAMADRYGKTPEGLVITITGQLLPDTRTADLQNIRLGEQPLRFQNLPENAAESSAVLQAHVFATAVANQNLQRHRIGVREQLYSTNLQGLASSDVAG